MLIPNKFSGFHNGVRRCFGGGGGGGGGGDGTGGDPASIGEPTGGDPASIGAPGVGPGAPGGDGTNYVYTPTYTNNTGVNTNQGNITGMNSTGGNTGGYGGPGINTTQGMATLGSAKGTPWGQSGAYYNDLLNQGFSSDQIRNSASSMYGTPSDANWNAMVQNAGMNSPTGRPMAGSDQFYQPIYKSSYMNYARPATQFDVSSYGTQATNSPLMNRTSRNTVNTALSDFYNTNYRDNPNGMSMSDTLNFMREKGINRDDFQAWAGKNNYSPTTSTYQQQTPFNPYTNSYGNYMPQMQNPYSPQQPNYQPQMQTPFSYQQPSAMTPRPPMQPPVSQPSYQPNYGPSALPAYVYDTIRDLNQYKSQPVPQRMSSGPSQAIVGRSSQMRGTPNVMRRAEGGITSLLDQDE
jgi:hypothetical protein